MNIKTGLDFDPKFIEYARDKLLFIEDLTLRQLIIKYCIENKTSRLINKNSYLKTTILSDITNRLKKLARDTSSNLKTMNINSISNSIYIRKINNNINKNVRRLKNNKIIVKKQTLNYTNYIEGFINCILKYYDIEFNLDCIVDTKLELSVSNKLYQVMSNLSANNNMNMNKINQTKVLNQHGYISLEKYIIVLYNSDVEKKNSIILNIFKKIAEKLNSLQQYCLFIHGDMHPNNIFIKYDTYHLNNTSDINIIFIDFGYSVVKLPVNNNQTYILSAAVDVNLIPKQYMDISDISNKYLKAIDMYHLFDYYLQIYYDNENEIKEKLKYSNLFKKFIFTIAKKYVDIKSRRNEIFRSVHIYTSDKIFQSLNSGSILSLNTNILYPENFMMLNINDDGKLVNGLEYIITNNINGNYNNAKNKIISRTYNKNINGLSSSVTQPPRKPRKNTRRRNNNNTIYQGLGLGLGLGKLGFNNENKNKIPNPPNHPIFSSNNNERPNPRNFNSNNNSHPFVTNRQKKNNNIPNSPNFNYNNIPNPPNFNYNNIPNPPNFNYNNNIPNPPNFNYNNNIPNPPNFNYNSNSPQFVTKRQKK
jgi:hypothetical protein